LRSRGFTDDTLKIFGLGYALDGWDILKSAAKEAGYREDYLQMVGLLTSGEKKVDMYRDRIMFPIHNMSGRVVGFGGRYLVKKENSPKYINSPESEIYNKRKILYGLFQAKKAIIKEDRCLLVEGYTDVMALHQAGVQHVVSSSGTALTTEQIRLIRRLTPNVTILYDGDAAGIKASFRGIDMLLEEGMNVRVILFPEGEDPDSFAKNRSPEEITDFLAQKEQDFIRFKVQILHKDIGNDPVARAGMIREMVRTVALVPDTLTRTLLIKECADITQMDEAVLTHELGKIRREQFKDKQKSSLPQDTPDQDVYTDSGFAKASPQTPDPATQPATFPEQAELARLMVEFGPAEIQFPGEEKPTTVQAFIVEELHADELSFNQMPFTLVWNEAMRGMEENLPPFTQEHWLNHEQPELRSFAIGTLTSPYQLSENWEKKHGILAEPPEQILRNRVKRAVISFKLRHVTDLIQSLQHALKTLSEENAASQEATSDDFSEKVTQEAAKQAREEQELKILEELQELDAVKKQFSVELSRVILT
jgi:DNA primase